MAQSKIYPSAVVAMGDFTIVETKAPFGYVLDPTPITVTLGEMGVVRTFENTKEKITLEGSKTWEDQDNQDGKRPEFITIRLLADGVEVDSKEVTQADNWTWTFDNLDKYNDQTEIVYTIEEDPVTDYSSEIAGFDVTNKYTPGKTNIQVTKVWEDQDDQDGIRPESITVQLLADGVLTGDELVLSQENGWTDDFRELDEFKDGTKITYTVQEATVTGYDVSITGDATTGFVVTNTHEPEKLSIEGRKTWDDSDNQDGKRPESITIRLLANGTEVATKEVTQADNWTWKFDNLDKKQNGIDIQYVITEDSVTDYSSEITGFDVTNKYTPGKTNIQVTKVWEDEQDKDGIRPESTTIKLLADGVLTDKELVLNQENDWKGNFTDLDLYKDGIKIIYTIEEVEVKDYEVQITGDATKGFVVTNTYQVKVPDQPVYIPVKPRPTEPPEVITKTPTVVKTPKPTTKAPKTGDMTNQMTWIGLLSIAAISLAVLNRKKVSGK
ncbi:MAG: Cna B-type domain-containing protein [Tissierellia bacterium]|nr:Cna B-type domain-containing protein [Tissierellia bacterium]